MKSQTQSFRIFLMLSVIFLIGCTQTDHSKKLSPILEKYIEYWNTGEFQNIEEILHPDFELRMTPEFKPERGIENFKNSVLKWRTAYPDFFLTVNEYLFDKNKIAALWTISATNTGAGVHPPTGKHVEVMGMSIIHFENGKIKDEWIASNNQYWLQQLGFRMVAPTTE